MWHSIFSFNPSTPQRLTFELFVLWLQVDLPLVEPHAVPVLHLLVQLAQVAGVRLDLTHHRRQTSGRKEGNVLFNDTLNTFYLQLYGIGHQIVIEETHCRHMGYSFRLTARVLLYAPSHRQDSTYHGLCYTSRGALAGMRNIKLLEGKLFFYFLSVFLSDKTMLNRFTRPILCLHATGRKEMFFI